MTRQSARGSLLAMAELSKEDWETFRRLARAAASQLRRRVKTACQVCGKEIESTLRQGRPYRRYCSPTCSTKAYRQRKRAKQEEQEAG